MKKGLVWVIIGLVLLIILTIILFIPNNPIKENINNQIKEIISEKNLPPEENSNQETGSLNPSSGSKSSGSGRSGNSQVSGSENSNSCTTNKIPFSIGGLVILEDCLYYDGDNCIEKNVQCSIDIKNRDSEIGGDFKGDISFFEKGHPTNILDIFLFEEYLGPGEETTIIATTLISDDENANKEIECIYKTTETPTVEICN